MKSRIEELVDMIRRKLAIILLFYSNIARIEVPNCEVHEGKTSRKRLWLDDLYLSVNTTLFQHCSVL